MLEYLYALSLLSITITLFYLTKSCFAFRGEIPHQGEQISNRIDKIHSVIDELADIIHEFGSSTPVQSMTQPEGNLMQTLLASFLTPKPMASEHGETQNTNRTIHEVDEKNITEIETELS